MHQLQPLAFSMALFFALTGVLGIVGSLLSLRTQVVAGLFGLSAGTLLLSYGGWLAVQARRHRFPHWIGELHAMLRI